MRRKVFVAIGMLAAIVAALVATSISTAAPSGVTKAADLFASKTTDVGDVYVWNDATNLYVEIDLATGYCMTESHVAAASALGGIPQVNGNPPPGQFPYQDTYSPCATTDTYTIPLAELGANPVVAVHAVVSEIKSMTIVSDATTTVTSFNGVAEGPNAAVAAYEPVGYPTCSSYQLSPATGSVWDTQNGGSASNDAGGPFAGATWIWRTANPAFPDAGEYATFVKTFDLPGTPYGGSILITADNGYQASLNGAFLGSGQITAPPFPGSLKEDGVNTTGWQTPETWTLPLQSGTNTLSIVAANEYAYPGDVPNLPTTGIGGDTSDLHGQCPNPGGLIFKAQASYLTHGETAWAGTAPNTSPFPGKNWATYFRFNPSLETATIYNVTSTPSAWTCTEGATNVTSPLTGSSVTWWMVGSTVTAKVVVDGALPNSTFDIWVEQNGPTPSNGTCPPGTNTPSNAASLSTDANGDGTATFSFSPISGAQKFWLSLWTPPGPPYPGPGAQVLRSTAVTLP